MFKYYYKFSGQSDNFGSPESSPKIVKSLTNLIFFRFKTPFVGTLNLRQETSERVQKELIQSDHPVPRKHPKSGPWTTILKIPNIEHVLDVFSGLGGPIKLIPFGAVRASHDASLE